MSTLSFRGRLMIGLLTVGLFLIATGMSWRHQPILAGLFALLSLLRAWLLLRQYQHLKRRHRQLNDS